MIIKNAATKNGIVDISTDNGIISYVGNISADGDIDVGGRIVIPGFVDTHIHGYGGYDAMRGEIGEMSVLLAREGTTCFLPTTMTDSFENLAAATDAAFRCDGAVAAGFHLEGPYISENRSGAQNKAYIRSPDISELSRLKNIKKITVAPELEGMTELIQDAGCVVSIGHTDCTYEQAIEAIEAGASCLTHTYNAMPPLLHRAPGPIGAALERGIYAELICDGIHVSRAAVTALYRMLGADRLMLVSDAISCAGMPDGKYTSGGLDVIVKDGTATLYDGTIAGGCRPLIRGVKKAVEYGIDFWDAVKMASETPARSLGLNKGRLEVGYDADIVVLNADLSVYATIVDGRLVYLIEQTEK